MTNKTNTVEELRKDVVRILAEHSEEPDDVLNMGTLTSFRPEYIVNDLVALFNQYAEEKFKKALDETRSYVEESFWNKALDQLRSRWEEESK